MVYQRTGRKTYSYDFWIAGQRLSGDTGKTNKREAEQVEAQIRREAKAQVEAAPIGPRMTFGAAAAAYMRQVGEHHVNALTDLADLERLEQYIGTSTLLADIDNELVARVIARRRGDFRQVGQVKNRTARVSNATVNRTCTEQLRKVLRRAETIWNVKVSKINWRQHMLPEPKERIREASVGEENAIRAKLSPGYDVAHDFALISGCRRIEIIRLCWHDVDFFSRQFTVLGKNGHPRTIPMSNKLYEMLWAQKDHHLEKVFTYEARRTNKKQGLVKGKRYPLTYEGFKVAARRAVKRAGVKNFRFHDTRHTAATRALRKSNLKVVQQLLGHADIATTVKYTHAMTEDVRAALEAASPTERPTGTRRKGAK